MKKTLKLYYKNRIKLSTGDALQWKSNTVLGFMIRLFAKSTNTKPWNIVNHTSQVITFNEYDSVRKYTTEALEKGIDLNLLSRRLNSYKGEVWCLPLKLKYNHVRRDIGNIALSHMGIEYDYGSLFKQVLTRVKANREKLFCSEHYFITVKEAFKINGIEELQNITIAPRPCDIPSLNIFGKPIKIK